MSTKVILISIDGMRPEGALQCGNPFIKKLMGYASYYCPGKMKKSLALQGGQNIRRKSKMMEKSREKGNKFSEIKKGNLL